MRLSAGFAACCLTAAGAVAGVRGRALVANSVTDAVDGLRLPSRFAIPSTSGRQTSSIDAVLDLRGGAKRKKKAPAAASPSDKSSDRSATGSKKVTGSKKDKPDDSPSDIVSAFNGIPKFTRYYITAIAAVTVLGALIGDELAQAFLALDPIRLFYGMQIWRPLTAASIVGPPSVNWIITPYYIYQYGGALEKAYDPANYIVLLFTQLILTSILSMAIGMPYTTTAVSIGLLQVKAQATPKEKAGVLVLQIPLWLLPYGLATVDFLQAGSLAVVVPYVIGVLSGHFYHFHRFVWPKLGGEDWLKAPDFFVRLLDPDAKSKNAGKKSLNKALKSRQKGTGKKLGK